MQRLPITIAASAAERFRRRISVSAAKLRLIVVRPSDQAYPVKTLEPGEKRRILFPARRFLAGGWFYAHSRSPSHAVAVCLPPGNLHRECALKALKVSFRGAASLVFPSVPGGTAGKNPASSGRTAGRCLLTCGTGLGHGLRLRMSLHHGARE